MSHVAGLATLLAAFGIAASAAAAPAETPPAGAATPVAKAPALERVRLYPLEGLPPDSASRAEFDAAFRAEFSALVLPLEGAGELPNRFRLARDGDDDGVWTLQVIVGLPPVIKPASVPTGAPGAPAQRGRASRGVTLAVVALSPEAIAGGARAMPERFALVFPIPPPPPGAAPQMPRGGYSIPWDDAGRASARLALELLHHRADALPERARVSIAPAVRAAARPQGAE